MSTEEVYFRSFVTAAATAAVVAFLVVGLGLVGRKRLGKAGLGIVGGVALAFAWIAAHIAMRGAEPWADLMRGGNGWRRFLWPIEVIDRFPAFVVVALCGGLLAHAIDEKKGRTWKGARWVIRLVTCGAIARLVLGPYPWSSVAEAVFIAGASVLGALWWRTMERSRTEKHPALLPATMAIVSAGFGWLMLLRYGITLGLVSGCGAIALAIVAVGANWNRRIVAGPSLCAVCAGGWIALLTTTLMFSTWWPLPSLLLGCLAPMVAGLLSEAWCSRRPTWNRWVVQLGTAATLLGIAIGIVYWIDHELVLRWP